MQINLHSSSGSGSSSCSSSLPLLVTAENYISIDFNVLSCLRYRILQSNKPQDQEQPNIFQRQVLFLDAGNVTQVHAAALGRAVNH